MFLNSPLQVVGYHSCDKSVGTTVLNGEDDLIPSNNSWDWLGDGIYFWELNPLMALDYAERNARGEQKNKNRIGSPFVLGAIINLGNCLNLLDLEAITVLKSGYEELKAIYGESGRGLPKNKGNIRTLDCMVFRHIQKSREQNNLPKHDTIRCAFQEDVPVYEGTTISSKLHIQISVINPDMISGYFLPRPIHKYNPHFKKEPSKP